MDFKYTLKLEDYVQANLDYIHFSKPFKKQFLIMKYSTAAILFIGASIIMQNITGICIGAVLAVMEILLFEKYYKLSFMRKLKKNIKKEDLAFYINGVKLTTNDTGFTISGKGKKIKHNWKDLIFAGESKEHIYLFFNDGMSEILPKRDFDMQLVEQEILTKVKEKVRDNYKNI